MNDIMFSIIIPTFNCGNRMVETIDSVIAQSYHNYEVIVQDGESTDNSLVFLERYKEDRRVLVFKEKDNGVYDAMNKAVNKASGDYCIFLGAGDRLYDERVLEIVSEKLSRSNIDVLCGYVKTDDNGNVGEIRVKPDWTYSIRFIPICHQSVFAKRELIKKRPFDTHYIIGADQDWLMYMKKKRKRFSYIDIPVAVYLRDGISSSEKGNDIFVQERREIHEKYFPLKYKLLSWHKKRKEMGYRI